MIEKDQISGKDFLPGKERPEGAAIFEFIWQKYSSRIYNFIISMVFDKSSAEDLTQEVFLKIWEKRNDIDVDRNLEGYIFTIARNLIYKETRKMLTNAAFMDYTSQSVEEADDSTIKVIDAYSQQNHLLDIINQLPPSRKDIYLLNKIHGLSVKDIAERLSISVRTVENQLYKANIFIKSKFSMSVFAFIWIYLTYGKF